MLALFWPIFLLLLLFVCGTPAAILVTRDLTWGPRYALALGYFGGLGAAWLMVPWGGTYLVARAVSLWIGARPVLWAGLGGIVISVVASGFLGWVSLLIAGPSLCVMISAGVRMRTEQ